MPDGDEGGEKPGKKTEAAGPPGLAAQIDTALDTARTTLKWMVGAGAAVGAVLIAGISLADFEKVSDARLDDAKLYAFGAVGSIALLLLLTYIGLTSRSYFTLDEAVQHSKAARQLQRDASATEALHEFADIQMRGVDDPCVPLALLPGQLAKVNREQREAMFARAQADVDGSDPKKLARLDLELTKATVTAEVVRSVSNQLTELAAFSRRQRGLRFVAAGISLCLVAASVAIVGFAINTRPRPTTSVSAILLKPVEATVKFTTAGVAKAKAAGVPEECATVERKVLVLQPIPAGFRVALLPVDGCTQVPVLELGDADATFGSIG